MSNKWRWVAIGLMVLLLVASTNRVAAENPNPIKIGFLTTLTGLGAKDGPLMVKGFQFYLDQIGNKMGGRPVELVVEDDEAHNRTAITKLRKLVEKDKVDVVSGIIYTPQAYAIAPIAEELEIPVVITIAGADDLSQRKRNKWVIRTSFTSSQSAMPFGEYVAKKLGYKKVVTIGTDYSHPWEVIGGFQKVFEENGGQVIQKIWVPTDSKDFTDLIKSINPNAEAIVSAVNGPAAEYFPVQLRKLRPNLPMLGMTASMEENTLQKVGEALLGAISANFYSAALDTQSNKRFVSAYRAKYGEDPCMYQQCAYTSAMWIGKAVDSLHGKVEDKEKFLEALKKTQLPDAPRGPMKLDAYGTVVQNIYIRRVEKVNDRYQNTVIYTYPMVSQFWKSKPEEFLKNPVFSKDYPPSTHVSNP